MGIKNTKMYNKFRGVREFFRSNPANCRGWKSDKKYIVIESDDWGSVRNSSKEAWEYLYRHGDAMDKEPFCHYDTFSSKEDLEALYSVLNKHKDKCGHTPVITVNCAMANPDFKKIAESDYQEYYWEAFTDTVRRKDEAILPTFKDGIKNKYLYPQLHCLEHFNVKSWMHDIKNDEYLKLLCRLGMFNSKRLFSKENAIGYMDSFNYHGADAEEYFSSLLEKAQKIFETTFSFRSKSFIAPCYVWNQNLEKVLYDKKIKWIQGGKCQLYPVDEGRKYVEIRHYFGERNSLRQIYSIRNCSFEPSCKDSSRHSHVECCLSQIRNAFLWQKPAVINSHRVNYVSGIFQENRDVNLKLLDELLENILRIWPDVEFINSEQLFEKMDA